jgi:hypothetical protein
MRKCGCGCGEPIPEGMRSDAKFCSGAHRTANHRAKKALLGGLAGALQALRGARTACPVPDPPAEPPSPPVTARGAAKPLRDELTEDQLIELIKETFDAEEFDDADELDAEEAPAR